MRAARQRYCQMAPVLDVQSRRRYAATASPTAGVIDSQTELVLDSWTVWQPG